MSELEDEELAAVVEDNAEYLVAVMEAAELLGVSVADLQGLRGPRGLPGVGAPGPKGDAGAAGGSAYELTKTSRGPLSSGRVVRLDNASYCAPVSPLSASDALMPVGIIEYAVSAAELAVRVLVYGEHEDTSWSFTPGGVLFLGTNGFLTQTQDPAWAYARVMGFAVTATRVFIDPQLPVFRGG